MPLQHPGKISRNLMTLRRQRSRSGNECSLMRHRQLERFRAGTSHNKVSFPHAPEAADFLLLHFQIGRQGKLPASQRQFQAAICVRLPFYAQIIDGMSRTPDFNA